jgi:hypothetical protein
MIQALSKAVISGTLAVPLALAARGLVYHFYKQSTVPATSFLEGLLAWSIAGTAVALFVLLTYGIPLFLLLRKYRIANVFSCCITAAVPSALIATLAGEPAFLLQYGYISIVSALAFWLFARRALLQPNNSFKPKPLRGSA